MANMTASEQLANLERHERAAIMADSGSAGVAARELDRRTRRHPETLAELDEWVRVAAAVRAKLPKPCPRALEEKIEAARPLLVELRGALELLDAPTGTS